MIKSLVRKYMFNIQNVHSQCLQFLKWMQFSVLHSLKKFSVLHFLIFYIYITFQCVISVLETFSLPSPSLPISWRKKAGWVTREHELCLQFNGDNYEYWGLLYHVVLHRLVSLFFYLGSRLIFTVTTTTVTEDGHKTSFNRRYLYTFFKNYNKHIKIFVEFF